MCPMNLHCPPVSSGSQFTDAFRVTKARHLIRVFPFIHDGEPHLAAMNVIHFVGQGNPPIPCTGKDCETCAEYERTEDRRLRRVTRYPMAIVDVEADAGTVKRFDAPSSVYKKILAIVNEGDPEDYLGNDGVDLVLKYDKNAQPSDQYTVMPKLKGSKQLDIDVDEGVPDLVEEIERDRMNPGKRADADFLGDEADDRPVVRFKDVKGKVVEGHDTGRRRGKKLVVQVDGSLRQVDPEKVVKNGTQKKTKKR